MRILLQGLYLRTRESADPKDYEVKNFIQLGKTEVAAYTVLCNVLGEHVAR